MSLSDFILLGLLAVGALVYGTVSYVTAASPGTVMRFFARRQTQRDVRLPTIMRLAAAVPPYPWLMHGVQPDEFVRISSDDPGMFPRMLMAIRLVGVLGLAASALVLAVSLVAIVVAK